MSSLNNCSSGSWKNNWVFPKRHQALWLARRECEDIPSATREERQIWTNCEWFWLHFIKNWEDCTFFVKKWFWKASESEVRVLEDEYKLMKKTLGNIVPNQSIIHDPKDNTVFVFCSPVTIKFDLLNKGNEEYSRKIIKEDEALKNK